MLPWLTNKRVLPESLIETCDLIELERVCRFILDQLGTGSGYSRIYRDCTGRLEILGGKDAMLSVYFRCPENCGEPVSTCITIGSNGSLVYYAKPHLSEKEAGVSDDGISYLPWYNWLREPYTQAKGKLHADTELTV